MTRAPAWFDISARDAARSREFYAELFGREIQVDESMDYGLVEAAPDQIPGGIGQAGGDSPHERDIALSLADVPLKLAMEALANGRDQSEAPMQEPWPLHAWPDVPTRYLLCRDDRFFPAEWLRGVVSQRLGIVADEIDDGHCPFLSRPEALAERLVGYWDAR